jgi:hypothetical protein
MGAMLLIVFGSLGIGFFLIFLLALSDKKRKESGGGERLLTPPEFEKACLLVVEGMKLEIEEINRAGEARLDMIARNPTPITGGQYLVHCLYVDPKQVIDAPQIIELSNMVVQERLSKGIFITTGRFTEEIPSIGELAPMEFIDGQAFKKLLAKYAPDYLIIR